LTVFGSQNGFEICKILQKYNIVADFQEMFVISLSSLSQNKKVQQKSHSSKYLSAFLQAIRHQLRHPG
jgi:hypothetical protein